MFQSINEDKNPFNIGSNRLKTLFFVCALLVNLGMGSSYPDKN